MKKVFIVSYEMGSVCLNYWCESQQEVFAESYQSPHPDGPIVKIVEEEISDREWEVIEWAEKALARIAQCCEEGENKDYDFLKTLPGQRHDAFVLHSVVPNIVARFCKKATRTDQLHVVYKLEP